LGEIHIIVGILLDYKKKLLKQLWGIEIEILVENISGN
jgi:hypothetical protein